MLIAVIVLSIVLLVFLIALITIGRNSKKLKYIIVETESKAKADIDNLIAKHSNEKTMLENKCLAEIEAAKNECNRQIGEMRDEVSAARIDCERQIREARESIENRKDTLSKMSDKELSIAIMLALDGYSDRFNRLENYLDHKQIKETIQQVSAATIQSIEIKEQAIQEKLVTVESSISTEIEKTRKSFKSGVDDVDNKAILIKEKLNSIETELSNEVNNLRQAISNQVNEMNQSISDKVLVSVDFINNQINNMKYSLSDSINDYDIVNKLNHISTNLSSVYSTLNEITGQLLALDSMRNGIDTIKTNICDENEYGSLPYIINDAVSKIEEYKSDIEEIKTSVCDEYSYDSIASKISSISSELDSIKNEVEYGRRAAEDAKSAAEDAKYAAESNSSGY